MPQQPFKEELLNMPIAGLDMTEEFKGLAIRYNYYSLGDMLKLGRPYHLLKHPGFGYRMLFEFTHILCENGLGKYLN